jgi:exopolysaccharide biosynthesis protein
MKQILIGLVFVGLFVASIFFADNTYFVDRPAPTPTPGPISTPVSTLEEMKTIEAQAGSFKYAFFEVGDIANLALRPNFTQKLGSDRIIENETCGALVNGGFYNTDNEPIGWFFVEGEELSSEEENRLFNGRLMLATDSAKILDEVVSAGVVFGLQSGPLLIIDSETTNLGIRDDESRRRVVAAVDEGQNLTFMVIVGLNSLFEGPLLADLPEVVEAISRQEDMLIVDAMNLDGGSASTYYDGTVRIRETSYVGSYFCLIGNN